MKTEQEFLIMNDKTNTKEYVIVRSPGVYWVITLHILGYTIQWAMDFLQTLFQNKYFSYCAYQLCRLLSGAK